MANQDKDLPIRLETILSWAGEGKMVAGEVELAKQHISEKILSEIGEGEEVDSYLLVAHFTFQVEGKTYTVLKTYLKGYRSELMDVSGANQKIANARLKMDYKRLASAGIKLKEQFFEERRIR